MKKLIDRFILNDALPFEARLANMLYFVGAGSCFGMMVSRIFMAASWVLISVIFLILCAIIFLIWYSNKYKRYRQGAWIAVVCICDILFPSAFFALGGVRGSSAAYFVLSIAIIFFLIYDNKLLPTLVIHIGLACFVYWLGTVRPELIVPLGEHLRIADQIVSFVIIGVCIGLLIRFQRDIFLEEKGKLDKAIQKITKQDTVLKAINRSASMLIASETGEFKETLTETMQLIGTTMELDRIFIWRSFNSEELQVLVPTYGWSRGTGRAPIEGEVFPVRPTATCWENRVAAGQIVNGPISSFSEEDRVNLASYDVVSILFIPIYMQEKYWGFASFADLENERFFTSDEQDMLHSIGLMMVNMIERADTLEKLELAKDAALESAKAKSDFLANMSHEIRTPLNAVIGMTAIGEQAESVEKKNYSFGKIQSASNHLLGVINDILDMSKIEAGKMELSQEEMNLREMFAKVESVIRFRADEKAQRLATEIDERIPVFIFCDEQRLMQILLNLLGNAVKFTPEGGRIGMKLELLHEDTEAGLCTIGFSVSDTGIGISPEQQEKIFRSFEQAENNTARKYGGTGLGLAISQKLVECMGGTLRVESEPGQGSVFRFEIEAARGNGRTAADGAEQTSVTPGMFKNFRVLLAEDVAINREILATILESTDISIECAENGLEAVEMFRADPARWDLIFMDVQMPQMDGYLATKQIRAMDLPEAKTVPIIAMTANVFREDIQNCLDAGMNGHLGKPIDIDAVMNVMRRHLL